MFLGATSHLLRTFFCLEESSSECLQKLGDPEKDSNIENLED